MAMLALPRSSTVTSREHAPLQNPSAELNALPVSGVHTTCQFSSKIFYPDGVTPPLFATDPLDNYRFDQDKLSFYANNVSVELSEDGNTYTIKSSRSTKSIVDVKITKIAPGFVVGSNGTSFYGTNPEKPWGSMRHAFWPRCKVQGSFMTPSGEVDLTGRGLLSHALQAMKPHHAGMDLSSNKEDKS
jgi:hypothetical protein